MSARDEPAQANEWKQSGASADVRPLTPVEYGEMILIKLF